MILDAFPKYPSPEDTIYKIEIPFSSLLTEVKPGLLISINGKVRESANRFDIDLINESEDVIFHFNPRFSEKCVVRNSRINNVWGKEERDGAFPFLQNFAFGVLILITENEYRVSVNGRHFTDYIHRRPLSEVKQIRIDGDVHIDCVKYRMDPLYLSTNNQLALRPCTLYSPKIPIDHDISGKVVPGFMIYVSGRPHASSFRFSFNFKREIDDTKGVPFHFDVRFGENTVVRNSYHNAWGDEERWIPYFPFTRGTAFDMIFLVSDNDFKVAINGQHFVNFNHRVLPLTVIKYFNVCGHITINSIRFCE